MIGGDVSVAGTVNNTVVAVNGDVLIRSSAHIKGVIIVIGGHLQQEDGADVTNDIVSISFDNATVNSLIIGSGLILGIGALKLAASLLMLIVPVLMVALGKRKTAALVDRYRNAPRGKIFSMGFFAGLLLVAVSALLLLTIIGIPFILLIALFIIAAVAVGLTVASRVFGEQIRGTSDKPDWVRTGAGAFILISAINIPFIGLFILMALVLYSLGITTSWLESLLRNRKKSK
ncbi:hypothetical protein [Cohnella zeiphila]|uniref:DUF8173 domain-containing protein n=1 Tax=Cohnella zeiphila TaxID=2761120 RepID=A0A7X0SR79_9BACL|nr:hypothetical protein [Cohnella zeiphila]MBB6734471.1 hypothetical protein [Cohnella zeiphila]